MRLVKRKKKRINLSTAAEMIFGICIKLDKTTRSISSASSIGSWEPVFGILEKRRFWQTAILGKHLMDNVRYAKNLCDLSKTKPKLDRYRHMKS